MDMVIVLFIISILVTVYYYKAKTSRGGTQPVYLLDFACFKHPSSYRFPLSSTVEHSRLLLDEESADFVQRILERSGISDETGLPPSARCIPLINTLNGSHEEAEEVIFTSIDEVLRKTKINVKDVDVLIINCSIFVPMPSLTAMVVKKYKLKSDIRSYNLSGMGCGCAPLSVGLARDLLYGHPDSVALIVSTEIVTCPAWYMGNNRSMLIANCLFRIGAASIILSNRGCDIPFAKYKLLHVVRTHIGANDQAYDSLRQQEDDEGRLGVALSKDVMPLSGIALRDNLRVLGPLVLPYWEQLLYVWSMVAKWKTRYVPNFGQAFHHICIHAGGRAVIDAVQENLGLSDKQVEPSRMTLHRFGNTSSSSVWYSLCYIEAKGRMKKGQKVWQIGLGSGFKCNSAVWMCMKDVKETEGAWSDCIDRYPVHIPDTITIL